ncbi:hypothetical protein JCGZ_18380 [Jatropha curcas]|uniref:Uncharacterized protein n=1 Tax=Jatropha curcas TaxID=180498 RepID=A0A067KCT9_JATCU|nr:hypothetical protein JCGZ_18380 [Jatropha curcas]
MECMCIIHRLLHQLQTVGGQSVPLHLGKSIDKAAKACLSSTLLNPLRQPIKPFTGWIDVAIEFPMPCALVQKQTILATKVANNLYGATRQPNNRQLATHINKAAKMAHFIHQSRSCNANQRLAIKPGLKSSPDTLPSAPSRLACHPVRFSRSEPGPIVRLDSGIFAMSALNGVTHLPMPINRHWG